MLTRKVHSMLSRGQTQLMAKGAIASAADVHIDDAKYQWEAQGSFCQLRDHLLIAGGQALQPHRSTAELAEHQSRG